MLLTDRSAMVEVQVQWAVNWEEIDDVIIKGEPNLYSIAAAANVALDDEPRLYGLFHAELSLHFRALTDYCMIDQMLPNLQNAKGR